MNRPKYIRLHTAGFRKSTLRSFGMRSTFQAYRAVLLLVALIFKVGNGFVPIVDRPQSISWATNFQSFRHRIGEVQEVRRESSQCSARINNDEEILVEDEVAGNNSDPGLSETNAIDNDRIIQGTKNKLLFPGGGIFFYWQAGAITYLRENGYDLNNVSMAGASAGALSATLTATGVDFRDATELALNLSRKAGVWDRPLGLQGIWGPIIYEWLDTLLPHNAVEQVSDDRLALLVTPVPSFGKSRISTFHDREDLIRCNMASVHIPWFLDGKLTSNFRDKPHIDGSVFSKASDYFDRRVAKKSRVVKIDWTQDPVMEERSNEFIKLVSPEGIWGMLEQGKNYAKIMEDRGDFKYLPQL